MLVVFLKLISMVKPDMLKIIMMLIKCQKKAISILSNRKILEKFKNNAFLKAKEYDINNIVPSV